MTDFVKFHHNSLHFGETYHFNALTFLTLLKINTTGFPFTGIKKCELPTPNCVWGMKQTPGGVLGQVSDRDAPHRPSTRNATRVKKGGRNYTFCPILMKNRGRNTTFSSFLLKYRGQNTTFSSFLLKYRGRNSTNFPETWKRGVETEEQWVPPPGNKPRRKYREYVSKQCDAFENITSNYW